MAIPSPHFLIKERKSGGQESKTMWSQAPEAQGRGGRFSVTLRARGLAYCLKTVNNHLLCQPGLRPHQSGGPERKKPLKFNFPKQSLVPVGNGSWVKIQQTSHRFHSDLVAEAEVALWASGQQKDTVESQAYTQGEPGFSLNNQRGTTRFWTNQGGKIPAASFPGKPQEGKQQPGREEPPHGDQRTQDLQPQSSPRPPSPDIRVWPLGEPQEGRGVARGWGWGGGGWEDTLVFPERLYTD